MGLLVLIALLLIFLMTFNWNNAKPWLGSRISEATGRSFVIQGNLSLSWHKFYRGEPGWRSWIPWPRLAAQDVILGNPEWAKTSPHMAEINSLTFSINPLALLRKKIIIPTLYLDTPHLWLERLADGQNNWTFKRKDPSKWQLDLEDVVLDKGTINLQDAVKNLDFTADVDTLDDSDTSEYGVSWKVRGTFKNAAVCGSGKAGAVLTLRDQDTPFPVEANVQVGKTTVAIDGTLTNPAHLSAVDMQLKLSGASLAHLYALSGIVLPETPPFSTKGHLIGVLKNSQGKWTYEKFTGKVGASDLSGTMEFQQREPRPLLTGTVVSKLLNFADLAPIVGADSAASKAKRDAPQVQPTDKIDLKREQMALVIKPETKSFRIFSLRAPLYVTGSFKKPDVEVDKGVLALKAGSAIALGTAAPVAALLPLVNAGPKQHSECANLLSEIRGKPVAPPPGKTYRDKKAPARSTE